MRTKDRVQIAISLFAGGILALSVFMGTLAGNFLLEGIKRLPEDKSLFVFGLIFSIIFIILILLFIRFSLIVLFNPSSTDFHSFGNIVKKIFMIK